MRRTLIRHGTTGLLKTLARLARVRGLGAGASVALIAGLGRAVALAREVRETRHPLTLGRQWQRAFAATKQVPIVHIDETTAYAEIHTPCPLRGSGDLEACHRMMAYDRAYMARANAEFVVLRSQAEPGVGVCRVAMRHRSYPADDLVPARVRAR